MLWANDDRHTKSKKSDKLAVMTQNKTQIPNAEVADFMARVGPARRADETVVLDNLFRKVTGYEPRMWGPTIIGYGRYHYTYASGREGDSLATGFSPRKAALSIYIMPGYSDFSSILRRLGKHKTGKSCLYVNGLADVDLTVLEELIRAGLDDLNTRWEINES